MTYKEQNNQLIIELKPLNYIQGLQWVITAAHIGEEQNHHADILFTYDTVKISVTTHSEGHKVTEKDHVYMDTLLERIKEPI